MRSNWHAENLDLRLCGEWAERVRMGGAAYMGGVGTHGRGSIHGRSGYAWAEVRTGLFRFAPSRPYISGKREMKVVGASRRFPMFPRRGVHRDMGGCEVHRLQTNW